MSGRFARQVVMPEVGPGGQAKLAAARVLLVGLGGLGCPAASYLAAAGVGHLGLVDGDQVSLENLHRQLLYRDSDVGRLKVNVASRELERLAPGLSTQSIPSFITHENADATLEGYDLVLDGTDRFEARYAVNDAAIRAGIPSVFGAIHGFSGQVSVFGLPDGPCYRCLFPTPPPQSSVPTCAEAGILGALPGLIGTWQALEALKLILGVGEPLSGRVLSFDGRKGATFSVTLERSSSCPTCSKLSRTAQILPRFTPMQLVEITPLELASELKSPLPPKLLDVREADELEICKLDFDYHIPLGELMERVSELNPDEDLVVYCRSGARSASASSFLAMRGFSKVRNLSTGIIGWSRAVDSTVQEY